MRNPPPPPEMTCGFLIQLVFCKKEKTMWFIGVEEEQETSAPPSLKNGSALSQYFGDNLLSDTWRQFSTVGRHFVFR